MEHAPRPKTHVLLESYTSQVPGAITARFPPVKSLQSTEPRRRVSCPCTCMRRPGGYGAGGDSSYSVLFCSVLHTILPCVGWRAARMSSWRHYSAWSTAGRFVYSRAFYVILDVFDRQSLHLCCCLALRLNPGDSGVIQPAYSRFAAPAGHTGAPLRDPEHGRQPTCGAKLVLPSVRTLKEWRDPEHGRHPTCGARRALPSV